MQERSERHVQFGLLESPHCCPDRECVGVERRVVSVDSPRKRDGGHLGVMLFVRKMELECVAVRAGLRGNALG